jgi:glycosyltransferase involved in cell wall biosynthesis
MSDKPHTRLSVVIPVHNEEHTLAELCRRLCMVLDTLSVAPEILFVDDGSRDRSFEVMRELAAKDARISVLRLSRNFGKEAAMLAGLDHAQGEAVVVMDADLQHPPELIADFVRHWRAGFDVVYAVRTARRDETLLKKTGTRWFYSLTRRWSDIEIPADASDYRLYSRRAVGALRQLREHHRFLKGMSAWIGYRQQPVPYEPAPRHAGRSSWNYRKLWRFAVEGLTAFSTVPLRIATWFGFWVAAAAFLFGAWIVAKTLLYGDPAQGFPTLAVLIAFLGGVQLLSLGILGEYLARVFSETKNRPLYLVEEYLPPRAPDLPLKK